MRDVALRSKSPPSWIALLALALVAASAVPKVAAQPVALIETNSAWALFKGGSDPSPGDRAAWRRGDFADAAWAQEPAPFGYGEPALFAGRGTQFPEMQNTWSSIFLRRKFAIANPAAFESLELRAICDDGFVAWINGRRVAAFNAPAGEPAFNGFATANASEPISFIPYRIPDPDSVLVVGENVLAIQVFNTSLGSSDLFFDAELTGLPSPSQGPVIAQVEPVPGPLVRLDRVTVVFSKPVRGVTADDFLVNGVSSSRVDGLGTTYTFFFAQPAFGPVEIRWGTLHGIEDFETPPRRFEITGPGSVWGYELVDPLGPALVDRQPPSGATVSDLAQVQVTFDKAVIGLDASDLLRNGVAATHVSGFGAGPFLFEFPAASAGTATISFVPGHGITSDALEPKAFAPNTWSYNVVPQARPAPLRITEFMAENYTAVRDEDQDPEDWIEIQNPTASSVNLEGWSLSRDPDDPGQWVFPSFDLPAGGHLVVYASGKDRRPTTPTQRLHTNFKLNPNGGYLGLFGPGLPRQGVSELTYPEQGPNHSYGRENNTGEWKYFANGTPGSVNGRSPIRSTVDDVAFSVPRGFFNGAFRLTLACPTPGATIRYTTNGSPPTLTDGFTYTQSIPIDVSRVIRAAAFRTNSLPSRVTTHSYLLNQAATRLRIPALSLVTATNNLYGRTGIMEVNPRNTTKRGAAWERPVSAEWILPDGDDGFQVDCGLRVQGGDYVRGQYNYRSTQLPFSKYSFRLYFRGEYGQGRLDYPLFPDTTQTSFDTIVLRAGMNDVTNPFLTDELVRALVRDTGQPSPSGTFVHLFLNGVYRGYYNPCERIDVDFLRAYHGGGEKWDLMAQYGEVREGDASAFNTLRSIASTRDLTLAANYRDVLSRLDVTNFVDYLLPLIYVDNDDWPHNNWRAARERVASGRYRMYCWDAEWAFGLVNGHAPTWDTIRNQLSSTSPPWGGADIQRIFLGLKKSPEFRQLFADRVHRHFFNGGALTDESIRARYSVMTNRLAGIVSGFNTRVATTWIPQRRRNVLLHFDRSGFLASSNAPGFNQFGGAVSAGFRLVMTNVSGTIYYTTNGVDPRVPFTGDISPDAKPFSAAFPILASTEIRARSLVTTNWSAVTDASFVVRQLGMPLVISEIMYNPPGGSTFEFLELENQGGLPLDLAGFSFRGITFRFPVPSPALASGARWILANDARPADFKARYPNVEVAGWFGGSLDNAGERLEILDPDGRLVTAVEYDNQFPWPVLADGQGASLEFLGGTRDPHDPAAWFSNPVAGGSPARAGTPPSLSAVRLSEIVAARAPSSDWIELLNAGATAVDLEAWSLSDNEMPRQFVFPRGTSIPAQGRLQIWCDTNSSPQRLHTGFRLSRLGETIALYDPASRLVDVVTFGPLPEGYSLGRLDDRTDWTLTEPTPLAPNEAAPVAEPSNIAINEWLANPVPGEDDWIELHNLSPTLPVALRGLYVGTSNALTRIQVPAWIAPAGHVVFKADASPGPDHLGLELPGATGAIVLHDTNGNELSRVTYRVPMEGYPAGAEGISLGRLPDGVGSIVAFPESPSPGAANYRPATSGPRLNEWMAANLTAVRHPAGHAADWIEIRNPGATTFDMSGCRLSVGRSDPDQWSFPPGTRIAADGYVLVWCDPTLPATTNLVAALNLGRGLPREGTSLWLFDSSLRVLDSVEFGNQLADQSSGYSPQGTPGLLSRPTPAAENSQAAPLGNVSSLRLNEWLADPSEGPDWIEVYNPDSLPVDLGQAFLTDDPSVGGITLHRLAPLTLIPPFGHLLWKADGRTDRGTDHLPFSLDSGGETVRLYAPNRSLLDSISFDPQRPDVASGRFPDGADPIEAFPGSASPGESNWRVHPSLVISEVLSHTDPPLEDAIELLNASSRPLVLDRWLVSPSSSDLDKYRIPAGTILNPGEFFVLYERDFNVPGNPGAFTLNSAHGDHVWVSETDPSGRLTGFRAHVAVGPAANGFSFGRYRTSVGWEFPPLSRPTFGIDLPSSVAEFRQGRGRPNAYPLVGPVVISEIRPGSSAATIPESGPPPDDEFIELHNTGLSALPLYDPNAPTNTWRLRGGIEFEFPSNADLPARGFALVVRFDPHSPAGTHFRARHQVPVDVPLFGPFRGRLDNQGDVVRLERPDNPQRWPAPDAGFVPYLLIERVAYLSGPTWPRLPTSGESSFQRRSVSEYANDPVNWTAGLPSPGAPIRPLPTDLDFDGMPNAWEVAYGLDPASAQDAALDFDGDGLSNLAEYLAGTDPRQASSSLTLRLGLEPSAGLVVRFPARANRSYSLLVRDDPVLGDWRRILDIPEDVDDRDAAIPLGAPLGEAAILKVVTPAVP